MEDTNNIPNQFNLPEDYFKSSKAGILNKMEWLEEHEAYPVLSGIKNNNVFSVPENYFESNIAKLELIEFPFLNNVVKKNPFQVTSSYFERSKADIENKIACSKELSEFKLLSVLEKTSALTSPDIYFTENKKRIETLIKGKGGARIISLNCAIWFAAAAVLTITVGLWIYSSFFNESVSIDENCNTLACIEKRELMKYKLDNLDNDELYEMVNTEKLLKNLNKIENTDSLSGTDTIDNTLMDYIE